MEIATDTFLLKYKNEMMAELDAILSYWINNTCDNVNGGFIGRIDENNIPYINAPKGAVLNSRILWAFSSAFTITKNEKYLHIARIAYNYLVNKFIDQKYGGVYWSVTAYGRPLDTKKQIYALAFSIYGCSAYFEASKNEAARNTAIELYHTIEKHSFDTQYTGYLDAFARDWTGMEDIRLSAKDANEKKTMNTHLHILEAYTTLYQIWPDTGLKEKITLLLKNFTTHIIDANTHHLQLFFDEQWNTKAATISYGHDIEAAWLLQEAAEKIQDGPLINGIKNIAIKITGAAAGGLGTDGGLWYEYEPSSGHYTKEKHSWVQAEAMVGFFNAWQLTGDKTYLQKSWGSWQYVQSCIWDKQYGEWYWGRNEDGALMQGQDKVGIWKCPYHNSRACIEIINRISALAI
jgi:cellobiose epimerase